MTASMFVALLCFLVVGATLLFILVRGLFQEEPMDDPDPRCDRADYRWRVGLARSGYRT